MRSSLLVLSSLFLVAPLSAQSNSDFEFHRELATGRRFHLSDIIGDVRVTGTSGRTVEVTAVKRKGRHGKPEDVTIEVVEVDDGVALCVRYPHQYSGHPGSREGGSRNPCSSDGSWSGNGDRNDTVVDFTVRVPSGLRLHIGTVSGDVTAEQLDGDLELSSVSGDVRLSGGKGPAIALETVSGDVTLQDVRSKDVSGRTISGEVEFRGPLVDAGSYDFGTTSGDITLTLLDRPNATLSAATFSGSFSSDLPTTQDESRRHRRRVAATWGNGSAKLDVESLSGDIAIRLAKN
jgi:hypothetical protein